VVALATREWGLSGKEWAQAVIVTERTPEKSITYYVTLPLKKRFFWAEIKSGNT
jgi:hypothetical protein